jgi:hypothetical protein
LVLLGITHLAGVVRRLVWPIARTIDVAGAFVHDVFAKAVLGIAFAGATRKQLADHVTSRQTFPSPITGVAKRAGVTVFAARSFLGWAPYEVARSHIADLAGVAFVGGTVRVTRTIDETGALVHHA